MRKFKVDIDLSELNNEARFDLTQQLFDSLTAYKKELFMSDNMEYLCDSDVSEEYKDRGLYDDDDSNCEPDDDSCQIDYERLTDDQRCHILTRLLNSFERSRFHVPLPLDRAVSVVKEMYSYKTWK